MRGSCRSAHDRASRWRIPPGRSPVRAFTSERSALVETLERPLPKDFGSPIWSATDRAMSALNTESGRHVIVLLSDGADNQQDILGQPPQGKSTREAAELCKRAGASLAPLIGRFRRTWCRPTIFSRSSR